MDFLSKNLESIPEGLAKNGAITVHSGTSSKHD
jgi:hypothetical protein